MSNTTAPTISPSAVPSSSSSFVPSLNPSSHSSTQPTVVLSGVPSLTSTVVPSQTPSEALSFAPSLIPSTVPSTVPSPFLSTGPSVSPTIKIVSSTSSRPSSIPSSSPLFPPTQQRGVKDYAIFGGIGGAFTLLFIYVLCSKLRTEMKGRKERLAIPHYGDSQEGSARSDRIEGRLWSIRKTHREQVDSYDFGYDAERGEVESLRQSNTRSFVGIEGGLRVPVEEEKSEIQRESLAPTLALAPAPAPGQMQPSSSINDFMNDDGLLDLGGELPSTYNRGNFSSSGPSSSGGARSGTDYSSGIENDLSIDEEFPDNTHRSIADTTGVSLATSTGNHTTREDINMQNTTEEIIDESLSDSGDDNHKISPVNSGDDSNAIQENNEQEKNNDGTEKS